MVDIKSVALQVKNNCNISDAQFWGYYSPCGLLLRMRDLYRIEHHMPPWDPVNNDRIKQWIDDREQLWHELEGRDFQEITVNGSSYAPFDIEGINTALSQHGHLYSAGYGNRLKPVFMLAELSDSRLLDGFTIFISGREISRDLSITPAMTRGKMVFVRSETMELFYWDKFEEMKAMRRDTSLYRAFREYGIEKDAEHTVPFEDLKARFAAMINEEIQTYIHHELGEASLRKELGAWWQDLIMKIPHSRAEFFVRSLKDVLADTCPPGMLLHIIKNKKRGSLAFYVALLGGFRKIAFPGMAPAYEEFTATGNWDSIEKARSEGYKKIRKYVEQLKRMYDKGGLTQELIEKTFLLDKV